MATGFGMASAAAPWLSDPITSQCIRVAAVLADAIRPHRWRYDTAMTSPPAGSSAPIASLRVMAADIKIAHSVFALPFALLASFMAALPLDTELNWSRFSGQLVLIVLAMVFARTVAMLANRLIDREIDARNPRTADRALPSGRLTPSRAVRALVVCAGCFLMVCASFGFLFDNWWPGILSVPVLLWISAYAFLKRFTAWSHLYLGSSLAISPLAAALAIDPAALHQTALWLLSGMVLCWVAGFDVIYALQDIGVDRGQHLASIPARFGERRAIHISRGLHVIAAGCLIAVWVIDARLGAIFAIAVAVVLAILVYEHAAVAKWGTTKTALTFFTLNGVISCALGGLGVADILM